MHSNVTTKALALVKDRVASVLAEENGRAILMFSGGRDSSAIAAAFCNVFPRAQLHLLMIDNGLLSRLDTTRRQAELLKTLFPETDIIFEVKRVSQMMREVGMQYIERDFREYNFSTLLICVSCKLIMNYSAMRYAKETGINVVMDGYADRQSEFPEQTNEFMSLIKRVYQEAGVEYISPLYDHLVDKATVNLILHELGVYIPKQEPVCMWADSFSPAIPEEITRYAQMKLEQIRNSDSLLKC